MCHVGSHALNHRTILERLLITLLAYNFWTFSKFGLCLYALLSSTSSGQSKCQPKEGGISKKSKNLPVLISEVLFLVLSLSTVPSK